jgi:hypothetical protein
MPPLRNPYRAQIGFLTDDFLSEMAGTRPAMTNESNHPLYTGAGCEKKLARM